MRVIVGLLVLSTATVASADRAVVVELGDGAPFTTVELTEALRMRVAATGEPVRVRVTTVGGAVVVEAGDKTRRIALDGRTGPDAARLVALVAVDLLIADLAIAPPFVPTMPDATRSSEPPTTGPDPLRFSMTVLGGASRWDGALANVALDVAMANDRWLGAIEGGAGWLLGSQVDLTSASFRVVGGVRFGWVELRGGLTLVPITVSDGTGDRTLLVGGGGSARLRLPITRSTRVVIATGVDVFATRTEYERERMTIATTPWLAPWAAMGIEVSP